MIIIWKYKRGKFQSAVSLLARDSQRNILFISSSSCAVPVYCTDIFIGSLLNSRHSVEGLPCNTNSHPLFFLINIPFLSKHCSVPACMSCSVDAHGSLTNGPHPPSTTKRTNRQQQKEIRSRLVFCFIYFIVISRTITQFR